MMKKTFSRYLLYVILVIWSGMLHAQGGCDLLTKLHEDLTQAGPTLRPFFEDAANLGGKEDKASADGGVDDLSANTPFKQHLESAENKGVRAWDALFDLPSLRINVTKLQAVTDFSLAKNIDPSLIKTELNALSNYKDDLIKSFEISNGTIPHPLITNKGVVQTDGNLLGRLVNGQFVPVGNANAAGNMDYVIMQSGEILLGSKHTFLSGGADVLAAGTVKFNNGSIRAITNASGHYLPTPGEGMNFLRLFKSNGADISYATLTMYHDAGTLFKEILPSSPVRKLYD